MAEKNVDYLIKLINDLLDVEKLESGVIQLDRQEVPASLLVESAVGAVLDLAEKQKVEITWHAKPDIVNVDKSRLAQAIINLIANAINFSPPQGKVLVASVASAQELTIRVTDQGPGVPETHLEAVFERFQQVDNKRSSEKKGTGLGLPICKAIVELHGGTVGVESKVGEGSTFWMKIPRQAGISS